MHPASSPHQDSTRTLPLVDDTSKLYHATVSYHGHREHTTPEEISPCLFSLSSLIHSHTRRCPDYSLTPEDALTIASHQWVSNHACSLSVLSCKPARRLISPKSQPSSQLSGHLTNIPHHDHFFLPHADHHLSFSGYSFSEPLLMVMAPLGILISSLRPHHFLNCKPQDATKLHLFT